jgi:hypothetical protein
LLRFSDARNFGRTLTGLALIAGPLLMLLAGIIGPDTENDNKLKELNSVAAHKSAYIFGSVLFLLSTLVLLAASVGIIHLFRGRRVTLGQIAGSLLLIGTATTFAFYAFSITEYEMVNQKGLDRAQLADYLHKANMTASGTPIFVLFCWASSSGSSCWPSPSGAAGWSRSGPPPSSSSAVCLRSPAAKARWPASSTPCCS